MNATAQERTAEILLVEDSPADVRLVQEALKESTIAYHLHVVHNGVEAMAFLLREGENADTPRPDLILLDLHLPKKNGCEVLTEIKKDDQLKTIPVCVLSTSSDQQDIRRAYGADANGYITKAIDVDEFMAQVRAASDYWSTLGIPPSEE